MLIDHISAFLIYRTPTYDSQLINPQCWEHDTIRQLAERETCLCASLHLDVEVRLTYALTSLTSFLKWEAHFVAHDTLGHVYRLKYEPISRNWKPLPKRKKEKTQESRTSINSNCLCILSLKNNDLHSVQQPGSKVMWLFPVQPPTLHYSLSANNPDFIHI